MFQLWGDVKSDEIEKNRQRLVAAKEESSKLHALVVRICTDIMLDAIVVGANGLRIEPYPESLRKIDGQRYIVSNYELEREHVVITSKENWVQDIPRKLYLHYARNKKWTDEDFVRFKKQVDDLWDRLPTAYNPIAFIKPDPVMDRICDGYELDGFYAVATKKCKTIEDDESPVHNVASQLTWLKGFCPDTLIGTRNENIGIITRDLLESVYGRHGIDNDLSDIAAWCERNPTRCSPERSCYRAK